MNDRKRFVLPILVLFFGAAWLLYAAGCMNNLEWIWSVVTGSLGICVLVFCDYNRGNFTVGSFLIALGLGILAYQLRILSLHWLIPLEIVALGALMLIGQMLPPAIERRDPEPPAP